MKLKRKKRLLLGLSGLLVLLLTNCEKDYPEATLNNKLTTSRFDIRVLNSEQIRSNAKVMDELQKIAGQTKAQATGTGTPIGTSRILYNSTYGFSVNTAYVKYVEDTTTGKHSYNFPLTRDSLVTSHLENLLLSSRSDGSYDAYIVEYGFSKDEYNAVSQTTLNNTTTRYYPIDFDTSVFDSGELNKMVLEYSCVEIWSLEVVPAHQGDNTGGELYTEEWVLVSNECTWNYYDDGTDGSGGSTTTTTGVETSGGVGGSAGGTSTTGSSSDSGNSTDIGDTCKGCGDSDIISSPATEPAEELITPCSELKKLIDNPQTLQALNNLDTYVSDTKEWGYAIKTFPNSTVTAAPQVIQSDPKDPNRIKMEDYTGGDYYGAYHTHPTPSTGIVPMFSHGDVKWLFKVAKKHNKSPKRRQDYYVYFLTLTCVHGTYAIKIKDWIKFSVFITNGYDNFFEELEKKYAKMNGSSAGSVDLEKTFLSLMKKYDMGMGLYELSPDKTQWSELTLNEDPATFYNPVTTTPCNE
ncbi:hypothetical protein DI487_01015 [Flavobacterium sediminis]|uniref:DUF4329 domain-containing protein n=1 Tax=Flavobacterium sediminis TaxID=2201181 RepID=A0A2U8QR84_9FLAO|nr:hypothetical protein [Flavobacterium sediminis]AWM12591.1 hypothetical protein DI487_01015 [Flavobacterium sediminis]